MLLWLHRFVDLGFDRYHVEKPEHEPLRMQVITNRIGNGDICGAITLAGTHSSAIANFVFLCASYSFLLKKKSFKKAEGKTLFMMTSQQ